MTQIILAVQYDWRLAALAAAITCYASYVAFELAGRMAGAHGGRREWFWIGGGAAVMGLGMWATQCTGMLAMVLPVTVRYNVPLVVFSLLLAVAAAAAALFVVSRPELGEAYLIGGSLALGGGLAGLHYCGMAAMEFAASAVYNAGLVALSLVIAVTAAGAALRLAMVRGAPGHAERPRWLAAGVMAVAISATHYSAMAAVTFRYAQAMATSARAVSGSGLSISGIALLTLAVVGLSIVGARVERKFSLRQQLSLSEQERWLLVASGSLDGLFDFDLVTGQVFYSERWKAMLGYGPEELEPNQETWRSFLHVEDRQAAEDTLEQYLRSGQGALEMEYRVRHRNGDTLWIKARWQAIWDELKNPVRLVGCHSDITARKRSEERLAVSEARYRGLFEANPQPGWIYSPQTLQIEDANQAAMDYYGWTRDQFLGLNVNSIGMPGAEPPAEAGEETAVRERPKIPWRLRRKNKSGIWVELSNYEIQGADAPAHLMIANDVTSHVVNQTKIERAKGQLETQLERTTEDLEMVEAQWRSLAEASNQLVWSALSDGTCDYVNGRWAEYCGVAIEELLGRGWLETLHPADRAAVEEAREEAMQTGDIYKLAYRVRSQSGSYVRFDGQILPVRAAADKPITRWIGISSRLEEGG